MNPTPPIRIAYFQRRPLDFHRSLEEYFDGIRRHLPNDFEPRVEISPYASKGLLPRIATLRQARGRQGDLNHIAGDIHFVALGLDPARTILTIADCEGLHRLRGLRRRMLKTFWFDWPVRRATVVTTISEATRQDVLGWTGVRSDKIVTIPVFIGERFQHSPQASVAAKPRLLQVGTTVNKNIERLALALAGRPCRLDVVGRLAESQRRALVDAGVEFENHIGISNDALLELYRACDVVTFASTWEGFGMPILEAQAVGRVVVTANVSSMPEVAGDAAELVDPLDPASIRAGIDRVLDDPSRRNRLIASGLANVRRYRAETISARFADLYRSIARPPGSLSRH